MKCIHSEMISAKYIQFPPPSIQVLLFVKIRIRRQRQYLEVFTMQIGNASRAILPLNVLVGIQLLSRNEM